MVFFGENSIGCLGYSQSRVKRKSLGEGDDCKIFVGSVAAPSFAGARKCLRNAAEEPLRSGFTYERMLFCYARETGCSIARFSIGSDLCPSLHMLYLATAGSQRYQTHHYCQDLQP